MPEATDRKNGRFQSTWDFPPADHKPKLNHTFPPEVSNTYIILKTELSMKTLSKHGGDSLLLSWWRGRGAGGLRHN
jgi:hypothetical protein